MNTTRRLVFPEVNRVAFEDVPAPAPKPDQLLIKTRCTLISTGTELAMLTGKFGWKFPQHPGYCNIGTVLEAGAEVDREWIGRRVASYGGHTQLHCKTLSLIRPIPDAIPDEQAAFFTLGEIVMNGIRRGHVAWGESIVVYGAGLLGQLAARFCRLCGAKPVMVVDLADSRLKLVPNMPGMHTINAQREDVVQRVGQITRQRMADGVLEITGNADAIPQAMLPLRRQGRLVLIGSPRGLTTIDLHKLCNAPSYSIIGTHNASHPPVETPDNPWTKPRHNEMFFELILDGEIDLGPLISHDAPFAEALGLYEMLTTDRSQAMGVIMRWE